MPVQNRLGITARANATRALGLSLCPGFQRLTAFLDAVGDHRFAAGEPEDPQRREALPSLATYPTLLCAAVGYAVTKRLDDAESR